MPIGDATNLQGIYDGVTYNASGNFSFSASKNRRSMLIVSYFYFEAFSIYSNVYTMKNLKVKLKADVNMLDAVVLSAGIFEVGGNS